MAKKSRKTVWSAAIIAADVIALGILSLLLWPFPISFNWHWFKGHASGDSALVSTPLNVSMDPAVVVGAPLSITAVVGDARGDAWCGTSGAGLWRLSASDGQWTHMTPPWGDSGVSCLAIDAAGRVWVGHDSAGLSIYGNGQWRHYDLTSAPIGPHVFAIATCPRDNDVWVASDLALARYSFKNDAWTSIGRVNGTLPAWPISSLAFDASGNLLAGTPADGLLLASASDGYSKWRQVTGPEMMPSTPIGSGLPTNEINSVLAGSDGTLYAATMYGLARSEDHGSTWTYLRGADLGIHIDQSYMHFGARPPPRTPALLATVVAWPRRPLLADWVSTLAQDAAGHIWLGYRGAGYECRSSDIESASEPRPSVGGPRFVSSIASIHGPGGTTILVGGRDGMAGTCALESVRGPWPTMRSASSGSGNAASALPALEAVPSVDILNAMRQKVLALPKSDGAATAEYLGDDWTTGGDWPGRYGRCLVFRSGGNPSRKSVVSGAYDLTKFVGPYVRDTNVNEGLMPADVPADANWLYGFGGRGMRRLGWIDDGTTGRDEFPSTMQGPDLYVGVRVPDGVHAISLYFYTGRDPRDDAAAGQRDYLIQIKKGDDIKPNDQWHADSPEQLIPIELEPALAAARVNGFADCGVYERFAVHGRGIWWVKISRNYSDSTRLAGVFVDKLGGDQPAGKLPGINTIPATIAMPADATQPSDPLAAAAYSLWAALDGAKESTGYAAMDLPYRAAAYRAAASAGVPEQWLANWRAFLHAYTDADKTAFRTAMGLLPAAPRTPQ
jgi:hypothetical protein